MDIWIKRLENPTLLCTYIIFYEPFGFHFGYILHNIDTCFWIYFSMCMYECLININREIKKIYIKNERTIWSSFAIASHTPQSKYLISINSTSTYIQTNICYDYAYKHGFGCFEQSYGWIKRRRKKISFGCKNLLVTM